MLGAYVYKREECGCRITGEGNLQSPLRIEYCLGHTDTSLPESDEIATAIRERVLNGRDGGGFVEAIARRDYAAALSRADGTNRRRFWRIAAYREQRLPHYYEALEREEPVGSENEEGQND